MGTPSTSQTTWADIQRLAADLQRVQSAETNKRLTEANCVEIVSMLMSMGLVDLVISTDGKEYITSKHLVTECANECLASDGRIALTELAAQLNVNLDHVNGAVSKLLLQQQRTAEENGQEEEDEMPEIASSGFIVCAGELIHRDFINKACARLDAGLQELGHISMLQLTRHFNDNFNFTIFVLFRNT